MPGGWGLRSQTPVCDTFQLQCTFLLKHVSQFWHFCSLTIGLSPLLKRISSYVAHQATTSDLPFYDTFAATEYSSYKASDDVIACDLWFGHSPIKNPGYAYVWGIAGLVKVDVVE